MLRPIFDTQENTREMISAFAGYNHRLIQNPGEFYDTENITTDDYPMLSVRKPIKTYKAPDLIASSGQQGNEKNTDFIIKNGKLCMMFEDQLYYNGNYYGISHLVGDGNLNAKQIKLLNFGTKILIFPYALYLDTDQPENGIQPLYARAVTKNNTLKLCNFNGEIYEKVLWMSTPPVGVGVGDYWIAYASNNNHVTLYQMQADGNRKMVANDVEKLWVQETEPYAESIAADDYWLDTSGTTGSGLGKYAQGTLYHYTDHGKTMIDNVIYSDTNVFTYWVDSTDIKNPVFMIYSSASEAFVPAGTAYVKCHLSSNTGIKVGDTVKVPSDYAYVPFINEWSNVVNKGEDENGEFIVIKNITKYNQPGYAYTFVKQIPVFDYVTVSQNRIWGCKYGYDESGKHVNQIYASKQGDPTNWYCFENVATDSYQLSLGDDEPFTGCCTFCDVPYFFKENKIYYVYGGYPAAYQLYTVEDRGIAQGSDQSVAVVNNCMIYKSASDVCLFDGSTVTSISSVLGNVAYTHAVAGSTLGKYYISMQNAETGAYATFVYDMNNGLWIKLNEKRFIGFISTHAGLLFGMDANRQLHSYGLDNTMTMQDLQLVDTEKAVEWYAETGAIDFSYPDKKYISNIDIRAKLPLHSTLEFFIQYDSSGNWERKAVLAGEGTPKTYVVDIIPQRCDHYALRFAGVGDARIISIANTMAQGSDR